MLPDEPTVAHLLGISEDDAMEILQTLTELQVVDEGLYPLIKAATKKFDDGKAMFVGWVLGYMVAKMHYAQRVEN